MARGELLKALSVVSMVIGLYRGVAVGFSIDEIITVLCVVLALMLIVEMDKNKIKTPQNQAAIFRIKRIVNGF